MVMSFNVFSTFYVGILMFITSHFVKAPWYQDFSVQENSITEDILGQRQKYPSSSLVRIVSPFSQKTCNLRPMARHT